MSANESTPPHAAQMIAFRKLLDTDKSCFRQDLRAPEALQALREYNTAAPTSLNASALAAPGPSAEDTTIFQGTCLVYAYLEQEQLLRPAWNGAPCALALDTVRTFTNFRGSFREERKITYMAMTPDDEEAHETTKPPWAPPPVCSGQGASENEAVRCKSPKAGTLQEFSMVISNKVMAIRAVDRVVTLTPPPREGEPDLDSLHYLPFSAAVGPMAVQKFPSPPGDDAWAKRRHDFYLAMQSTHGVSLSYDKKSGKLRVPKSMDQMLAAAPLLPAIMSLAPGLLKSQGVANVSAFCVAALQLASFACRFGRDRRVLELVPGLDFDDRPACLTDHTFLARQLLCVWRARIAGGVAGRNYHVHLAAVTECFIEIARDAERGGVSDDGPGHPKGTYLRLCWLGAVFTTMVKVRGSIVYGYRARAVMLNDARDVQLLCSDWPMGGCEWSFRFHCMRAVANKHGTLDSTGVQGEWELEVANQTNWDVASAAHVGLAAVRLAVKHCLVRATDIPPQELSACGVRPAEIVPTAPVGPPIDSCRRRKRARVVKCDSEEDCDEDWESGRRPRKARQKKGGRPVRVSDEEHASADDKDFVCIPSS